ncbi:hypothetical protein DRO24_01335 [Candidatus Bathyarchaeota archaeon]|nr:MAG: hypothetical protein DRO24_01335 [Candidatus Bathyarchaeota archaeon]
MPEIYYHENEVFLTEEEVEESAFVPERRIKIIVRYLKRCDEVFDEFFKFPVKIPKAKLSIAAFDFIRTVNSLSWDAPLAEELSNIIIKICKRLREINELYNQKHREEGRKAEAELKQALSNFKL